MDTPYDKLFKIQVEHKYFAEDRFTGFKLIPTAENRALYLKYGLLLKQESDGFIVLFATHFEGETRDKASLLKEISALQFELQLTDHSFYGFTENLPSGPEKWVFWLSNYDEKQQARRTSNLLHTSEFVSESDLKPSHKPLSYDGYIDIQLGNNLQDVLYIRFLNKSTLWRYVIIVHEDLLQFEKLAVLDKANQKRFLGPEIVELPNGSKGFAFTSTEPIPLTQHPNTHFQLVGHYKDSTSTFEKVLIPQLPTPSSVGGADISEILVYF